MMEQLSYIVSFAAHASILITTCMRISQRVAFNSTITQSIDPLSRDMCYIALSIHFIYFL